MIPRDFWIPETARGNRAEPIRSYLTGFGEALFATGHKANTVTFHLRAAAHLGCWLERRALAIEDLDRDSLAAFSAHLQSCHCPGRRRDQSPRSVARVRRFVEYLYQVGVVGSTCTVENTHAPRIPSLDAFLSWMASERGVTEATLESYRPKIVTLLDVLGENPADYSPQRLRRFILDESKSYAPGTTKKLITAVRMFLRFNIIDGNLPVGLDAAIPTVANWRLASLPAYLSTSAVESIIEACDPVTESGIRDRAILLLLARLGLRAGDILRMRITDIDWSDASVRLMGKARREVRLPVPQDVGDAILKYLEHARPACNFDRLFLRSTAPVRPLASRLSISSIVRMAIGRTAITSPSCGVRVLRHSAATTMLREGAMLQEIGKILRHRSVETTALYAKVDVVRLQQIAQPWPEVARC